MGHIRCLVCIGNLLHRSVVDISPVSDFTRFHVGGSESGLQSAFNHSWSYHRLQFGFGGVCRCVPGDLVWTCLVWAERSMPDNFWVPIHQINSFTGEQKGITQTIYIDSEPPSPMTNSLIPSAKLRSANLPFLTSLL